MNLVEKNFHVTVMMDLKQLKKKLRAPPLLVKIHLAKRHLSWATLILNICYFSFEFKSEKGKINILNLRLKSVK